MSLAVGGSSTQTLLVIEKGIGVKRKITMQLPMSSAEMGKKSKINQINAMRSSGEWCGQIIPLASEEEGFHTHEDERGMVWKELELLPYLGPHESYSVGGNSASRQGGSGVSSDLAARSLKLYSQECPAQWTLFPHQQHRQTDSTEQRFRCHLSLR